MIGNVIRAVSSFGRLDASYVSTIISTPYVKAQLDIEKTPAYMDIQSKNITCNIDSSVCQAEEGHKSTLQLVEENAQEGMDALRQYGIEQANIGNMFIHAGRGENVYKEVARSNLIGSIPDYGIKFIPSEMPKITWNMNELHIDPHPATVQYNWQTTIRAPVRMEREGGVTITEPVEPQFHIEYYGDNNTPSLFQSIDKQA